MKPTFKIVVDGADMTQDVMGRLIRLTLEDNIGLVNDRFSLSIDDRARDDGTLIALPPHGAVISVFLGYEKGEGVVNPMDGLKPMGRFEIDEIMLSKGSAGRAMTITARATDTNYSFVKKARSDEGAWRNIPLADLVTAIATRNDFKPRVHEDYKDLLVTLNQTSRSDADFLTTLSEKYNAAFKVQAGYLYFAPNGKFDEVALPDLVPDTVPVHETDCEAWSFTYQGRSNFTGARAKWRDKDTKAEAYALSYVTKHPDEAEAWYEMSEEFTNADEAAQAVNAKKRMLDYQRAKFSMTSIGYPLLMAGSMLQLRDFRSNTIPVEWRITSATHTFDSSGYVTSVDAEIKDSSDLESLPQGYENVDEEEAETGDESMDSGEEDPGDAGSGDDTFGEPDSNNPFLGDPKDFGNDEMTEDFDDP